MPSRLRILVGLTLFVVVLVPVLLLTAPAQAATVSDDFNRANGGLGSGWTATSDGGLSISSQVVAGSSATAGDVRTGEAYGSDQFSQVEVTSTQLTNGRWLGAGVRLQGSGQNGYVGLYFWNYGSPQLMVFKRSQGGWAQLGASVATAALPAGTQLRLSVTGSALSFLVNGVQKIAVSDASFTGGAPGIMTYGPARGDNWVGGGAAASAPTYSVGGSVAGASGSLVLQLNGAGDLAVPGSGAFTFAGQLASGASYAVSVKTAPAGQSCTVANGTGTVGSANVTNVAVSCAAVSTYSVGGSVAGASGSLVLQLNGGGDLAVPGSGAFTFGGQLASGASYAVSVKTAPAGQSCTVANGTGTVGSANVTNVAVSCAAASTYSVGGSVAGASGSLVLQLNGAGDLAVPGSGAFTFGGQLATGASYAVSVKTAPAGQSCSVANGTGTVGSANVTNVAVSCATAVTGTVSDDFNRANGGLGSGWTATSDGGLSISSQVVAGSSATAGDVRTGEAYGSDQFSQVEVTSTQLTNGRWLGAGVRLQGSGQNGYVGLYFWNYGSPQLMVFKRSQGGWAQLGASVATAALPAGTQLRLSVTGSALSFLVNGVQKIAVSDASFTGGAPGIMTYGPARGDNWVGGGAAASAPTYSVGGSVAGASGSLVLQLNGAGDLAVPGSGAFTFAGQLASGASYAVSVKTAPAGQSCSVANGTGTVGSANVTNVAVSCAAVSTYSVGGSVAGASGSLVLQLNGGGDLAVPGSGAFTFGGQLASGASYAVSVKTAPAGQSCTVANGTGTVGSANVTNVAVSCATAVTGTVSDDFNRADGGLGSGWTPTSDGGLSISSQAVLGLSGQVAADMRTAETFPADQLSQLELTSTPLTGSQWVGPGVRLQNAGQDGYLGIYSWNSGSPQLMLFKRAAGSWVQLGSITTAPLPAGTQLRLAAIGTTLSFVVNGVQRLTASDTSFGSGAPGILTYDAATADNWSAGPAGFEVDFLGADGNGVQSYNTISADNGYGAQVVRVLNPSNPAPGVPHRILFVLPVEAGLGATFGDGLETIRSLGAQNQYNLTVVEPSFAIDPWYANNPTDPNLSYETFMVKDLAPWVDQTFGTGSEQNWLIGFSKSGIGGQDLILKHPDVFALAASWDFPADMATYDQFGSNSASNYGTDASFQSGYRLTQSFVDAHKAPFLTNNRIWIGGYSLYGQDMADYASLLASEGYEFTAQTPTPAEHNWTNGWVPVALAALNQDSLAYRP